MKAESRGLRACLKPAAFRCGAFFAAAMALALVGNAHAQTTTIGGDQQSSVSVNTGVLNSLGPARNVPDLMLPSVHSLLMPNSKADRQSPRLQQLVPPSEGRIRLHPPRRSSASRAMASRSGAPHRRRAPKRVAPEKPQPLTRSAESTESSTKSTSPSSAPPPPPNIGGNASTASTTPSMPSAAPPPPPPPAAPSPKTANAAPPPPPSKAEKPAATQTASTTPSKSSESPGAFVPGKQFRLMFSAGGATLESPAEHTLDDIAKHMKKDESLRLQLLAYAGGGSQTESQARRLSLSRALKVRSYLLNRGIRSTRIDVRALGNKTDGGPPDRVDLIVTSR